MKRILTQGDTSSDEDEPPPRRTKAKPPPTPPPVDLSPIFFHAKCGTIYAELSNFFGGAENHYQASKMKPCDIRTFLLSLACKEISPEEHLSILKMLQPEKRNWTQAQEAYWTTSDGRPIGGIIAKLIGAVCNSEHLRSRFNAINDVLEERGIDVNESYRAPSGLEAWRRYEPLTLKKLTPAPEPF